MPIPGIQSIRNVTASYGFFNAAGEFTVTVNNLPASQADEVVIKSISWIGLPADGNLYLVWSNLNHDIIGSFAGSGNFSSSPGTRIILNGVVPNQLTFRLLNPSNLPDSPPVTSGLVTGDICIHMDFITYQR